MSEFVVVTGMSGAGRSTAAAALEDVGWFVIDNLPAGLIMKMVEMVDRPGSGIERVALVIGRGGSNTGPEYFDDLPDVLDELRATRKRVRVVFLDAPDDVLVRRYEGTRRRHPLAARGVEESIADERKLLEPVRERADLLVDTGELNSNQLRSRILEAFGDVEAPHMQTSVISFGYKHGIPLDVDLVFDCRFLPNPFWVEELRPFSGLDDPVRDYVLGQPESVGFLEKVDDLLTSILPAFVREGKSYLTIAMGCTGGRHRSVVLAHALAERLARSTGRPCPSSTGTSTGEHHPAIGRGDRRRARHRRHAAGGAALRRHRDGHRLGRRRRRQQREAARAAERGRAGRHPQVPGGAGGRGLGAAPPPSSAASTKGSWPATCSGT